MNDLFGNLLDSGVDLGKQYLASEISEHGHKAPETRPDTAAVPSGVPVATKNEVSKKTMLLVGGGIAAVLVLALILKK